MQGDVLDPQRQQQRPGEVAITLPRHSLTAVNVPQAGDGVIPSSRLRQAPWTSAMRGSLAQFQFQPFKKCFHVNCSMLFVPGDFKPSSPRRMFCSLECFEAHWREKLSRYLEDQSSRVRSAPQSTDQRAALGRVALY